MSTDRNRIICTLSERGRFWRVPFDDLTRPEQVFRAIWELEADVNNGGFDQYYFNGSGDTAFMVVGALEEIGATTTAAIVARANAFFPHSSPPRDRMVRQGLLLRFPETVSQQMDDLDREFYSYPDDLTVLLFAYVQGSATDIEGAMPLME